MAMTLLGLRNDGGGLLCGVRARLQGLLVLCDLTPGLPFQ